MQDKIEVQMKKVHLHSTVKYEATIVSQEKDSSTIPRFHSEVSLEEYSFMNKNGSLKLLCKCWGDNKKLW